MSDAGGATATGGDACEDCALADGPGCCGGHGATSLRSDRSVLALAGVVIAVIALAALSVPTSRHVIVLVPALPTAVLGVGLAGLGAVSLRSVGPTGDRAAALGLRGLPAGVAGLLVTLAAALLRVLTA